MSRRRAKKKIPYVPKVVVASVDKRPAMQVSEAYTGSFGGLGVPLPAERPWAPPTNLCESTAAGKSARIAMDSALNSSGYYSSIQAGILQVDGAEGITFIGYPALAMLQQNPLMRLIVDTMSDESTRKWVSLKGVDDKVGDDDIKRVEGYCEKWALRKLFKDASEMVGFQGGCLLYIDMGVVDDKELITPLVISANTIGKGKFKGFRMIEPMQVYPGLYEASDPLKASYFNPETWIVLGKEVHVSRFLYFANNVPSTILRPAYNFFGIPLVQLVLQYVANFESARDSSAEVVNNFSLLGLKTDMGEVITGGPATGLVNRAKIMLAAKRNQGLALIDKETEEFFQIDTPLSGLRDLVAQQLELLALIPGIPVTKLFGTAPTGMNATGESDMRNFYDKTRTWQETLYFDNFIKARQLLELTEFGAITDGIVETWEPLQEPNPTEQATIRKTNAETDAIYLEQGVILQEEVRKRLSADEESGYNGLELSIELPEPDPVEGQEAEALSVEGA
jgi:phage-related protein (TIGR01555 family)